MASYTTTTAPVTIPGVNQTVSVPVQDTSWMVPGNYVWFVVRGAANAGFVGPANFVIQSVTDSKNAVLMFLFAPGDLPTNTVLPTGTPLSAGAAPPNTPAAELQNLGASPAGQDVSSSGKVVSTNLGSPLPEAQGGTAQTTFSAALAAAGGLASENITIVTGVTINFGALTYSVTTATLHFTDGLLTSVT